MGKKELVWEETTNRFVVFLDIMGFKDMVAQNSHEFVVEKLRSLKNLFDTAVDGTNENMPMETGLRSFQFSDSYFVFSASDSAQDLLNLLHQCRIVLGVCYADMIPFKGAISYGKITADFKKSIFVGQPIIDAYLLHEELHMFGIVFDHKAESKMKELIETNPGYKNDLEFETIQYKIPMKMGKITHYCVQWSLVALPHEMEKTGYILMLHDKSRIENFYSTVSGKARIYVDNTIEFIEHLIELAKKTHPGIRTFIPPKRNK